MYTQKPKVVVSEEVKKLLDKLGSKNETYNDIILRLIEHKEVKEK